MKTKSSLPFLSVVLLLSSLSAGAHAQVSAKASAKTTSEKEGDAEGKSEAPAEPEEAEAKPEAETEEAPAEPETEAEASEEANDGKGFYLRMTAGPGYTWAQAEETNNQNDLSMQAWTGGLMVNPGYQLSESFAVHADLFTGFGFAREVTSEEDSETYVAENSGVVMYTLGAGATYHAMPADLYVSAGFGLTYAYATQWVNVQTDDGSELITSESETTGVGYGAHGSIGKLVAIHPRWSIGGALNYNFQHFSRRDDSALSLQRAHTLWLGFSAAFRPKGSNGK